jgi:hypothetical protein
MDDVDLHAWFKRDELESRAACGEQGAIRLPTNGSTLCLGCGAVRAADLPDAGTERTRRLTRPVVHSFQNGSVPTGTHRRPRETAHWQLAPRSNAAE